MSKHFIQNREREDAEAAMRLAEELEREELLKRQVRAIRDEQLAKRLQDVIFKHFIQIFIYK